VECIIINEFELKKLKSNTIMQTICYHELAFTPFESFLLIALVANDFWSSFLGPILLKLSNCWVIFVNFFAWRLTFKNSNLALKLLIPLFKCFLLISSFLEYRVVFNVSKIIELFLQKFVKELSSFFSVSLWSRNIWDCWRAFGDLSVKLYVWAICTIELLW